MFNTLIESQGNAQLTRNAASFFSSLVLHATIFVGLLAARLFFLEPKAEFLSAAPPPSPPLKLGSRPGAVKVVARASVAISTSLLAACYFAESFVASDFG